MEGLVALTNDLAVAMSWLLPAACYMAAFSCFIGALWSFYRRYNPLSGGQPDDKPWLPWLMIVLSGAFASFNVLLTKSNVSAGTGVQVSLADSLTSYTPTNSPMGGTGPKDAILNIIQDFALFFQMFGAWTCFFAVLTWLAVLKGRSSRSRMSCAVQYVFGIMLINPITEAQWLLSHWP